MKYWLKLLLFFLATTTVACAALCVDQRECTSAVFNISEFKCSLYESAMSEEVYSSTPNGLVYLVTSSARAEVRVVMLALLMSND